ncbi:MAG: sigma-70 family RNA polymerase sigma factor [Isosphaeraceae bacterium]
MDTHSEEESAPLPPADSDLSTVGADGIPPGRFAQEMEARRQYLLLVANRQIGHDLMSKAGPSDLVQQTFLEAHRDRERFQGRSSAELRSWLRRILLHNASNFARQFHSAGRQVRREVAIDRNDDGEQTRLELVCNTITPVRHAIHREQAEAVTRAIRELSERDQRLIRWHHQEHRSFEEMGKLLGTSADTARVAWARAVKRLQKLMALEDQTRMDVGVPPLREPGDARTAG